MIVFITLLLSHVSTILSADLADDSTTNLSMELYSTYHSIGIDIGYGGDQNNNLAAEFVYRRKGEREWQEGVNMTIIRERKRIYASGFRFSQGETVEFKVTLHDPDGVAQKELAGTTTIKRLVTEYPSNKKYVSNKGKDTNPGTVNKPFKTINKAVGNLKPGDEIIIEKGVYQEEITLNGVQGTADKPIIIKGPDTDKIATALDIKWFGKYQNPDFLVITSLKTIDRAFNWIKTDEDLYAVKVPDLKLNNQGSGIVMLDGK